jgi:hypothetical protein
MEFASIISHWVTAFNWQALKKPRVTVLIYSVELILGILTREN